VEKPAFPSYWMPKASIFERVAVLLINVDRPARGPVDLGEERLLCLTAR
jgi:hypothetical protein